MKILIALAFAALLAGCQSAPAMSSVRITLERGVCFGACPDYAVSITGDGQVTYHGRRFVRVTGEQHATASHADVAHLVSMLESARFFELRDSYRGQVTDLPSYRVTYQRGGRIKTVIDYAGEMAGMPHAVREIEAEIDRVGQTDQWVRRDNSTPPAK